MPNHGESQLIVFTALEGTLLSADDGSWKSLDAFLEELKSNDVPLVFCSSKTRSEQLALQEEIGIKEPFITENGSAVFFPSDYLSQRVPGAMAAPNAYGSAAALDVVELGIPAVRIRELLREVREASGFPLRGFSDMSVEEIADLTGLDRNAAARAAEREYSENVEVNLDDEEWNEFVLLLAERGLVCDTAWDFVTVTSALTDKGGAVRLVTEMLRREKGGAFTIGIGSDINDASMLEAVDKAFLLPLSDGTWDDVDDAENVSDVVDVLKY